MLETDDGMVMIRTMETYSPNMGAAQGPEWKHDNGHWSPGWHTDRKTGQVVRDDAETDDALIAKTVWHPSSNPTRIPA